MRVVVVSPHLDDAILSLAAAIHCATQRGATVEVLTVFAGDTTSQRRAGRWDRACGFAAAGEAATARRREDQIACELVGARASHLRFGDEQYGRGARPSEIVRAIREAVTDADLVLLPGFPLRHRDHRWLARTLAGADLGAAATGLYVEQPYAYLATEAPREESWRALAVAAASTRAKHAACQAYRSQLPVLPRGMLASIADYELRHGGEMIRYVGGCTDSFAQALASAWPA
jgi:LmbE family N-acetylglucosaminyl deacetylase